MDFIVKKTSELSDLEKEQINDLFNLVFEKNRSIREFENQVVNNPLGYAYHSLMLKDGRIVGHNAGIPSFYLVNGKKELFFCNTDTMIEKDCRGIDNFYDLINNAIEKYKEEGALLFYGFPNDNSYPIYVPLGLMEDVGKLDTYILPYRIGGVKKPFAAFNFLSILFSKAWINIASVFASDRENNFPIAKDEISYNATRYKRSDGNYSIEKIDDFTLYYKIINYEGIKTAFIIDLTKKTAKNFTKAVKYLIKHKGGEFDIIIYPGYLPFKNSGLIKVPHKFEPKHFNFTALMLKDGDKNLIFDIKNWDVNLSNYDLI